jgi:hypothetical protein
MASSSTAPSNAPQPPPAAAGAQPYEYLQLLAAAQLFPSLPSKSVSAFPPGWRKTTAGRFVAAVTKHLGWDNWGAVPAAERNQFRALLSLYESDLLPQAPPPAVVPPSVELQPSPFFPSCSDERDDKSVMMVVLDSDVLTRAEFGDALNRWDLKLMAFAMKLSGPEKGRWLNYYASNAHFAAYLCDVEGLPYPDSKTAIKHLGDRFESMYLDSDFRHCYLSATFGQLYYQIVTSSLKEIL